MKKVIPLLAAFVAIPIAGHSSLLVYEDFEYALSDGATMSGVATSATGLSGNYALATTGANGASGSAVYRTNGLTFGSNFATTGGALAISAIATTNNGGTAIIGAGLSITPPQAGTTIYNSYLVSMESRLSASTASLRINTGATTSGSSSYFSSNAKTGGGITQSSVAYSTTAVAETTSLAIGTTYLFVNSFSNTGASGGGTATTWVFDVTGYNSLVGAGISESAMNTYGLAKFSQTTSSGTFVFDNSRFLQLGTSSGTAGGSQIAVYDEIRYGTELSDVLSTVPEPSTYAGIAGAIVLGAAVSRRRTSRRASRVG